MINHKITKKAKEYARRIINCLNTNLHDIYKNPSQAKLRAFEWCYKKYCKDDNASNFRILGGNSSAFVVGWLTYTEKGFYVNIETKDNSHFLKYSDI